MKLPNIFKNQINENLRNSREIFYSGKKEANIPHHFPFQAIIQTKSHSFKAKVIGKTTNYLVTANGRIIYLKDCLNFRKI